MRIPGALAVLLGALLITACTDARDPRTAIAQGRYAEAAVRLRAQAAAGEVSAQTALGTLYYLGVGVERDFEEALRWYEQAALAGDPHAQRNLGSMFRHGHGTPPDDFRAFGWYDEARRGGNRQAVEYLRLTALSVGWNQQALARRIIAEDLRKHEVSHGSHRKALR